MREYGSEFDWLSNGGFLRDDGRGGLGLKGAEYFRSGRDALRSLAKMTQNWPDMDRELPDLTGKRPRLAVLPALCCESMIVPFKQNGYQVEFYKLREDLTADTEDLSAKLRDGAVLLYMRYFGIRPFEDGYLQSLRDGFRDLLLVEDRTQDILVSREDEDFRPDAMLASLRKWAALPEGAVLLTEREHPVGRADRRFCDMRRDAMESKSRWLTGSETDRKEDYLHRFHAAEEILDEPGEPAAITEEYRALIERMDFERILRRRRENIAALMETVGPLAQAGRLKLLTDAPEKSGLYLPILLEDRQPVRERMFELAMYCPFLWPIPEETKGLCGTSRYVAEHSLCLICDQRYGREDMERIAAELKSALG